jgi:hypothetical protein
MAIMLGVVLLLTIYALWKLFVDGWLFKIILFFAGWVGLYVILAVNVEGAKDIAFTMENGFTMSWAAVIPTAICVLTLLCTKVSND